MYAILPFDEPCKKVMLKKTGIVVELSQATVSLQLETSFILTWVINSTWMCSFNTSLIHLRICILLHAIVSYIWIRKHYQIHIHQVYVTLLIYHFNNSTHTHKKQN